MEIMQMADGGRERGDLVLNPGEFAYVQDRSKGNISVYVGPHKASMSETDAPVVWDKTQRKFVAVPQDRAVQSFVSVSDGSYVVLSNPAKSGGRPASGTPTNATELQNGRRVHMTGPTHFPLWPGEVAEVVTGHQLRSNEYLLVRVYNEDEAREHWKSAIMKPQVSVQSSASGTDAEVKVGTAVSIDKIDPAELRTGQLIIVRGNEISFFIPPTGIEVMSRRVQDGTYVRDAVTLERLEYCILLNEDGNKRYVRGPAVVFPNPTEEFVEKDDHARKFRAIELNENSGIYVKVIEDYAEGGMSHKTGDELFITGSTQPIYFPRQEHAVIKYGSAKIHYAVAVPKGEGRYVLDRMKGEVRLVRGPSMLLPDPRKEVIVQRILSEGTVRLWYPGNDEAIRFNTNLAELTAETPSGDFITADRLERARSMSLGSTGRPQRGASEYIAAESMSRGTSFTPPRTVTLNTKFDGAVAVSVWTGYAVLVVNKDGERKVVVGPDTVLLEYDETLMLMELSTGTPKTDTNLTRTVYLRVINNKVSDIITAETKDLCKVSVSVSYRVNFEGEDQEKWFAVENYVKFLTEHCRSLVRNAAKMNGIEDFYRNAISIVRDTILGPQRGESGERSRAGRVFPENGMKISDVEVLDVKIDNPAISTLLTEAQHKAVAEALKVAQAEDGLARLRRLEAVARDTAMEQAETEVVKANLREAKIERDKKNDLADAEAKAAVESKRKELEKDLQGLLDAISAAELLREKAGSDQELSVERARLQADTDAIKERMGALNEKLVSALQEFSDKALVEKLAESLAPLALLENQDVVALMGRYIEGTPLQGVLKKLQGRGGDR